MRVSSRADCGVRALYELALNYGRGPLQSREIASRQQIPEAYLHQVLSALNKIGLVKSTRGPSGGHELARDPSTITVMEVILALDGTDSKAHPHLPGQIADPVHDLWHDLLKRSEDFLASQSIEDLVERGRSVSPAPNYSI